MDEKKLVTWEAFKKYHEQLVGYIEDADGLILEGEEEAVEGEEDDS